MQLRKQAIRKTATYNEKTNPRGVRRRASDYNQVHNAQQRNRNTHGDSFSNKN